MATAILRPSTTNTTDMISRQTTSATWFSTIDPGDPVSHDDDTSYMRGELGDNWIGGVIGVPSAIGAVNSLTAYVRGDNRNEGNCTCRTYIWFGGANSSTYANVGPGGSGYATDSTTVVKPGGAAWGVNDFANNSTKFQLRCYITGDAITSTPRITSVWAELDYVPAGGGVSIFGLGMSWVPPLLAAGYTFINSIQQINSVFRNEDGVPHKWVETIPGPEELGYVNKLLVGSLS
jgi:hypothetical protein